MLSEIFIWCTTSCPRYVRAMEYLYQAIALRSRYKRRRESWQPHLEKTKAFIIKSAEKVSAREQVIVLGSGLLLDVPLVELSGMFKEVVLVDVVHLPEVRRRMKQYPNVTLVQADITGVAEQLYENLRKGINTLNESEPFIPMAGSNTGLIISLNIVSQLAAIPIDYVLKKSLPFDEQELDAWCDRIRMAHLEQLRTLESDICLIADHYFVRRDRLENVKEQGSTVGEIKLDEPDETWRWHIAPYGEERPDSSKELAVGAWFIRKRAQK